MLCVFLPACLAPSLQLDRLVEINHRTYKSKDLLLATQIEKYKIEKKYYDDMKKFFDDAAIADFVKKTATEKNISESSARNFIFKTTSPNDKDLKNYFDKNRDKIPYSYEFSKSELTTQVTEELEKKRQAEILSQLEKEGFYDFNVEQPEPPTVTISTGNLPTIGNEKNPLVTILEVFDYQCPFCKMEEPKIQRLLQKFPNDILLVVVDYTRIHGDFSRRLALGGFCAKKLGHYTEYREHFVGYMQSETQFIKEAAGILKVQPAVLTSCMNSADVRKHLDFSENLVQTWGLTQTPVFFLNGQFTGNQLNEQAIENFILAK